MAKPKASPKTGGAFRLTLGDNSKRWTLLKMTVLLTVLFICQTEKPSIHAGLRA
jgi:hypothetical protein